VTEAGTIVVIGATSQLAQSVAQPLATEGRDLLLLARDAQKLSTVAADLTTRGASVTQIVTDLAALDEHPALLASIEAAAEEDWQAAQASLTVNLLAPLSLLHGLANRLAARGSGSLVVVSSVAGDRGRASNYWYGTAKGALSIHCQGLRNRLAKTGVALLTVKPGFIDTAMTAHIPKNPAPLWASSDKVAGLILAGWRKQKDVIYTPGFWRLIMFIIGCIPEKMFKRLSL